MITSASNLNHILPNNNIQGSSNKNKKGNTIGDEFSNILNNHKKKDEYDKTTTITVRDARFVYVYDIDSEGKRHLISKVPRNKEAEGGKVTLCGELGIGTETQKYQKDIALDNTMLAKRINPKLQYKSLADKSIEGR